jgi:hypothetical protein
MESLGGKRRGVRAASSSFTFGVAGHSELEKWTPTPNNIKALPKALRRYIQELQANAEYAVQLREQNAALVQECGWLGKQLLDLTSGHPTPWDGLWQRDVSDLKQTSTRSFLDWPNVTTSIKYAMGTTLVALAVFVLWLGSSSWSGYSRVRVANGTDWYWYDHMTYGAPAARPDNRDKKTVQNQ